MKRNTSLLQPIPTVDEIDTAIVRTRVLESYSALTAALTGFKSALQSDSSMPARFEGGLVDHDARERALTLFGDFFLPDDEGRVEWCVEGRTVKGKGVIGASSATVVLAEKLNSAKDDFQATLGSIEGRVLEKVPVRTNRSVGGINGLFEPIQLSRHILNLCFGRSFSYHQACRRIEVFHDRPVSLSYTYASTRSVKRITVAQARALILRYGRTPGVQQALAVLYALPRDTPLAKVNNLNPHWRLNVVLTDDQAAARDDHRKRIMVTTSTPVIVGLQEREDLPVIRKLDDRPSPKSVESGILPKNASDKNVRRQKGYILQEHAFLPGFGLYRYQPDAVDGIRKDERWVKQLAEFG